MLDLLRAFLPLALLASPANAPPRAPAHSQTPPDSSSSPTAPPPNSPTACTLQTPPHAHPSANPPPPMAARSYHRSKDCHPERSEGPAFLFLARHSPLATRHFLPGRRSLIAGRLFQSQSARSPIAPVSPAIACSSSPPRESPPPSIPAHS